MANGRIPCRIAGVSLLTLLRVNKLLDVLDVHWSLNFSVQNTRFYDDDSIDTLDSSDNVEEPEAEHENVKQIPNLGKIVSRWHVCKPVRIFYDNECGKDYGMCPTCNPDLSFCSGYDAIYGKGEHEMLEQWIYGNKTIEDTTQERRYYEWVAHNSEFNDNGISHEAIMYENPYMYHHEYRCSYFPQKDKGMPKPWRSSFNEGYTKNMTPMDKVGTSQNLTPNEITNPFHQEDPILNIKICFPDFSQPRPSKPQPRDYSYEEWLRIKLGHTNVSKFVRNSVLNEWVLDSFDIDADYERTCDDPYSKRYSFDGGWSFICITKQLDDALPLGRANGSRFMGMIRKEMDEERGA
ncbi:hypothetical protein Tco_1044182 [Tanacetum coccineum]|uniref:Uncharacterized protein n=1 Tax=Tanacetum coccineum TaxID=301880 RepID=A0ABQ5GR63_9ASTR